MMKSKLLLSTAVLMAGFAYASAQTTPSGGSSQGAQHKMEQQGARGGEGQTSGQAQHEQNSQARPQRDQNNQAQHNESSGQGNRDNNKGKQKRSQSKRDQTTGQNQHNQAAGGGQSNQASEKSKRDQGKRKQQSQRDPNARGQQNQTAGQGQRDQSSQQKTSNQSKNNQTSSQGRRDQTTGQGQHEPNRQSSGGQSSRDQASGRSGEHVELNVQQRTQIREQVFAGGNAPRVDHVDFSLSVGTAVPSRVHVVAVPQVLITIHPEFRGREYFVVRDDIYIVEPGSRRIVAVVPVGSSGAQLAPSGRSHASSSSASLQVSSVEIRRVQTVLLEKGYRVEVDGRLGPRTRQALISFQRAQGFRATGEIDNRTMVALGVSVNEGGSRAQGNQNQPSTTGQGGQDRRDQPSSQQSNGKAGQRGKNPSTSGQGGMNQRSGSSGSQTNQNRSSNRGQSGQGSQNQPATSGQGSHGSSSDHNGANQPSTSGQSSTPNRSDVPNSSGNNAQQRQ